MATALRLHYLSSQLLDGERRDAQLEDLVQAAGAVAASLESYLGAAVNDARNRGQSWAAIGSAVRLSPAVARRKWQGYTGPEVPHAASALAIENASDNRAEQDVAPARSNREQLGTALRFLLGVSGRTVGAVANQAGIPAATFSRLLAGQRIPEWPTIFTLATILGGRPEELRALWESAKGRTPTAAHSGATAVTRFHDALRGLHLAAGRRPLSDLGLADAYGADKQRLLEAALSGDSMADWDDIALLVRHLGGDLNHFRRLWEDVQYSIFTLSVKAVGNGVD
ncbi:MULTISPECIES: helix-turn-helix domain-containing protein [Streptomyces griseus group]|uniref:helix-turn-helix domain-containing protein n=1 Tax=Streptomyces griseus group TaxID=629295 RepID=UPI0036774088